MDLKNKKPRKLTAKWVIEEKRDLERKHWLGRWHNDPPDTRMYESVYEAIARSLWRKFVKRFYKHKPTVEDELVEALSDEIRKEIDKEILADMAKVLGVPNDKLGNKR